MSRAQALLGWLEDKSDWLSPIVVKEVRQVVRGQELTYAFAASLLAGLAIAFVGAANALTGSGTSGSGTFYALIGCLALLGLAVVPLGAFNALRNERIDQTLELITLTALSPRRVVVGKLLAQGVKLVTLFAAMAPFIAMSFLLGGIDFVTILIGLVVLFTWSLWANAASLFLSCVFKSRTMSGLVFGAAGILLLVVFVLGRALMFVAGRGAFLAASGVSVAGAGPGSWRGLAIILTAALASMVNLVLLAENRLSLPTGNRVTPLRIGFLLQFLLIAGWALSFITGSTGDRAGAVAALKLFAGLHLALVAVFTVTEDLIVPRRALRRTTAGARGRWLLAMFHPGGGRGALYVLVQMAVLLPVAWALAPTGYNLRWFMAMCGYICFFTGVPALALRLLRPAARAALLARLAVMVLLAIAMLAPDIIHYLLWRPEVVDLSYARRHLLNPFRTLTNWGLVEMRGWFAVPLAMGLAGLAACLALIPFGRLMTVEPAADPDGPVQAADEPRRASVLD